MSAPERRYFWVDAPSPLHEAFDAANEKAAADVATINAFATSIGATSFAGADGFVYGFIFATPPANCAPYFWRLAGKTGSGDKYYGPSQRTKEGKSLATRMSARWYAVVGHELVRASGMQRHVVSGRYMHQTTAGWKDGRIFVCVPGAGEGDAFPAIPGYMTECKEWEKSRWFDVGRASIEGGAE